MLRIGFTGSRQSMSEPQMTTLRHELFGLFQNQMVKVAPEGRVKEIWLHHGDCVGCDAAAHDTAREFGFKIQGHPPDVDTWRAFKTCDVLLPCKPYLERNRDIVRAVDMLIATPSEMTAQHRGGTWYTWRFARDTHKPTILILPDGKVQRHEDSNATEQQGSV